MSCCDDYGYLEDTVNNSFLVFDEYLGIGGQHGHDVEEMVLHGGQ